MRILKKIILWTKVTISFLIFNSAIGQTNISFAVQQPQTPLVIDAGEDQIFISGNEYTLGGTPSALGGYGNYIFEWDNAQFLNNPNIANPIATGLSTSTIFTLTVWDSAYTCVKQDQVEIALITELKEWDRESEILLIYPNPFSDYIYISSRLPIQNIYLQNLTGQIISKHEASSAKQYKIDSNLFSNGIYLISIKLNNGSIKHKKICKTSLN